MKKLSVFGMAVALMAPVALVTAGPAGAATGTSCAAQTGTATIKPGLTNTAKDVVITATTTLTKCKGGGVTSGNGTATIKMKKANCGGLAKTGQVSNISEKITWSTKKVSTFTGTAKTGPKLGQATIAGKITVGPFKNMKVSTVIAFTPKKGEACTGAGLRHLTIKGVKPFVVK